MADIPVKIYRSTVVREGTQPSNPSTVEGVIFPPVNPPGSNPVFNAGIGIKLNNQVIGGVKRVIESSDILDIPIFWQYNIRGLTLDVDGVINNNGEINIG